MSHPSKQKGNKLEREVVAMAHLYELESKRAWGSNGQSNGWHPEVDVMIEKWRFQCKSRKKLGTVVKPSEHVDGQIIKENRGEIYVVLPLLDLLTLIKTNKYGNPPV